MTTICRDCRATVSRHAKACPHCGAPYPGTSARAQNVNKAILGIVFVFCPALILLIVGC